MSNHFLEKHELLSDECLISLCRQGDELAFSILVARYIPMISSRVTSVLSGYHMEHDDYVQEGLIALLSAVNSFDFKSSSFSTYARICVDRVLIDVIRKENAKSKIPGSLVVGFEETDFNEPNTPETLMLQREKVRELMAKLKSGLSGFEFAVLKAYLMGLTHKEIAEKLSVGVRAVNNAITRIRRKLSAFD